MEASVGVSLLCRTCAIKAVRDALDELSGSRATDVPVLGFMLLPMHIGDGFSEQLRANVTPELWVDPDNQMPC